MIYSDEYCAEALAGFGITSPEDVLIWRDRSDGGPLILRKAKSPDQGVSGLIIEIEKENLALVRYLLSGGAVETCDSSVFRSVSAQAI